ncbi:hypothetical protein DEO23_08450 [Brachybacterium endophyticum]|uniref:Uncharacterized protein n=2 Tax=Brachybacterium endophyticum TaxID=2182385 RepID=A0A2U2RM95_9MICO|nr:hypothetical protein DEO23_08450 [Brachybacterium endophyticum]
MGPGTAMPGATAPRTAPPEARARRASAPSPSASTLPDGDFGARLDAALSSRGLALERVCERLRTAGSAISPSTLSLWRHGRSRPRRNEAMRAVAELEVVLRVPRGYLLDALVRQAPARHWSADRIAEDPVQRARAEMGLDEGDTLQRLLIHHCLHIDRAHRLTRVGVRRVLRATRERVSRIGVTAHGASGTALRLVPRPGVRVGRQRAWPERGLLFTELLLDEPIVPGGLGILDYAVEPVDIGGPSLGDHGGYVFHTEFPVSSTVLEARFDPSVLPAEADCRVQSQAAPRSLAQWPVNVGPDGGATVVVHGLDAGSVRVSWSWGRR